MTNSDTVPGEGHTKGLSELLAKVQAATGPDRRIDAYLAVWFHDPKGWNWQIREDPGLIKDVSNYTDTAIPRFTASIDAALALVDRVLPGWEWACGNTSPDAGPWACLTSPDDWAPDYTGNAPTAPLAILSATLQALIEAQP